jgi:hypothetical protein
LASRVNPKKGNPINPNAVLHSNQEKSLDIDGMISEN